MTPRRAESPTTLPDIMRGVAGGVLLGLPLVYTQEVWMLGASLHPSLILLLLALAFVMNLALSHFVGFEPGRTFRPLEDAIVGFGLSFILSGVLLALLDRIELTSPTMNNLGIIALCAIPTSLGFALGNALAPKSGGEGSDQMTGGLGELLAAGAGAVVLSLNIAPTEEPVLLAYQIGVWRVVLLLLISLMLSYAMVFYAEFGGREGRTTTAGPFQHPLTETCIAYLIAFVISGIFLTIFGRLDGMNGASLSEMVVLSFPAAMGAALGRVIV